VQQHYAVQFGHTTQTVDNISVTYFYLISRIKSKMSSFKKLLMSALT